MMSRSGHGKSILKAPSRLALVLALGLCLSLSPAKANAEPMKEFVMSCSYGVLAGTLVGAATLAFTDMPGENLNKIARGASIGLYAGILLGLYVVYGVPSQNEEEEIVAGRVPEAPALQLYPLVSSENGLEGGAFRYSVLKF